VSSSRLTSTRDIWSYRKESNKEIVKEREYFSYEEWIRELGLFNQERRRLRGISLIYTNA